jgi:hypothetical protein
MPAFHSPASRWSAAAVHLALSLLLIGTVALYAFAQWYPAGLHHAAKLDRLMGIMLGVDIVAGPILTLILYRRGKKGLKIDLATIAILQTAFLAYGLGTLWQSRPLFLVGSQQAFALMFAPELPADAADRAEREHWPRFHGSGPWVVAVDLSSPVAKDEFLFSYMEGGTGPLGDMDLYVAYSPLSKSILKAAWKLGDDLRTPTGMDRSTLRFHTLLSSRSRTAAVLLDIATGEPVQIAALTKPPDKSNN